MPSFNQGRFIEESMQSVLSQDYPNVELIVIDGGSTDETLEVLKRYAGRLAHSVSEPDRGQAHAVNKGLDRCSGEIVGWLNSDDLYCPGAFRKVVEAFARHPDALVVHGDRILLDEGSRVSGWATLPPFDPPHTGYIVCSETAFWRSSQTGGARLREDLRFAMDLEFFSRLYQRGPFVKLHTFLGCFRCHSDNKSFTIPEVGRSEAGREWARAFGENDEGWARPVNTSLFRQWRTLVTHPCLVAAPYLYRRFILGRRGL